MAFNPPANLCRNSLKMYNSIEWKKRAFIFSVHFLDNPEVNWKLFNKFPSQLSLCAPIPHCLYLLCVPYSQHLFKEMTCDLIMEINYYKYSIIYMNLNTRLYVVAVTRDVYGYLSTRLSLSHIDYQLKFSWSITR